MEVISRVFQLTTTEASSTTDNKQVQIAEKPLDQILSTTAASLSILGSLTIIITFCLWPDVRTKSRLMIVFISFGDLLVASSNIIGIFLNNDLITCEIQATVNIAAILSSFFWTVYLSLYFYLTICQKITERTEKITMWLFHVTAWGIPVVIAAVGFGVQAVGNSKDMVSSGWCWIKSESGKAWWWTVLWMSIAGKGWEILAYIAISVFCFLVKLQIKHELNCGFVPGSHFLTLKSVEVARKAELKLIFIPVVFILLRIWGTIRFIFFLAYHPRYPHAQKWLIILHGIGDNSQGFADFVLFCLFTVKIRNKFRHCCGRFIPFCKYSAEQDPLFRSTNLCYGAVD